MRIPRAALDVMVAQAKREAPLEACGYLGGQGEDVRSVYPMRNVDASPDHFTLDPKEQFETVRAIRKEGDRLLAVYHSHPATPARPSQEDIRLAADPNLAYVIVSLAGAEPDAKAFRIVKGQVEKLALEVVG